MLGMVWQVCVPGAQIGAHFTINASDRTLRLSVGTALGIIAVIYAIMALGLYVQFSLAGLPIAGPPMQGRAAAPRRCI